VYSHLIQTFAYYCGFIVVGLAAVSLGPGIPSFAEFTGATIARTGMLFVFYRIGYVSGSLGGGRIIDRLGANRLTGLVVLFIAVPLLSLSFAGSLPLLFGSVLILGLCLGAAEVGAGTGIIRLHGAGVGPYMTGLHLSYCVGAIISPLIISGFLYSYASIRPAFWLMAAAAATAGFFILLVPRADSAGKKETASAKGTPVFIVFFAAILLFASAAESSFSGWVYSYAIKTKMAREGLAGILTSAFWGAMTFSRFAGIFLVTLLGARRLLFIACLGSVFSMSGLLFFPGSLTSLWLTTILSGFFQASIYPAVFTLAGERKIVSGGVAGIFVAASSLGGMIFPPLIGSLMQSVGLGAFPAVITMIQAMTFVSFLGIAYLTRKQPA
jgi:fucose permease